MPSDKVDSSHQDRDWSKVSISEFMAYMFVIGVCSAGMRWNNDEAATLAFAALLITIAAGALRTTFMLLGQVGTAIVAAVFVVVWCYFVNLSFEELYALLRTFVGAQH